MHLPKHHAVRIIVRFSAAGALTLACQGAYANAHMCVDAQGKKSYTDKPCAALDSYTTRVVESTDAGGRVCKELLERVNSTLKSMAELDNDVSPGYGANVYGKDLEATRTLYERRCGRKAPAAPPSKYAHSTNPSMPTAALDASKSAAESLGQTSADAAASTSNVNASRHVTDLDKAPLLDRLIDASAQVAKQAGQVILEFWWVLVIGAGFARLNWLKSKSTMIKPFVGRVASSARAFLRGVSACRRYVLAQADKYHRDILAHIQRRKNESASGDFVARTIKYSLGTGDYQLLSNVVLPTEDGTTQVDLILVSKFGVFVIKEKDRPGQILGDENSEEWQQITGAATNTFKNPLLENSKHVRTVMNLTRLDEAKVHSLIAFSGLAKFAKAMPGNVTAGMDFLNYIKSKRQQVLTPDDITRATRAIELARFRPTRAGSSQLANSKPAPTVESQPRANNANESPQT